MKLWNSSKIHTVALLIFFLNKTDPHWSSIVNFHSLLFPIGGALIHVNHFWASYLTHPVPVKTGLTLNSALNRCCWTGKPGHRSCVSRLGVILRQRQGRWEDLPEVTRQVTEPTIVFLTSSSMLSLFVFSFISFSDLLKSKPISTYGRCIQENCIFVYYKWCWFHASLLQERQCASRATQCSLHRLKKED